MTQQKQTKKPARRTKASKPTSARQPGTRDGSKSAIVLDLLRRKDGTTLEELMQATGWQAHSVRGFLSGVVAKKLGLLLTSAKTDDSERRYSIGD